MQSFLSKVVAWVKDHGTLWTACGLVLVALVRAGENDWTGAGTALLSAGTALHWWHFGTTDEAVVAPLPPAPPSA